jgi:hypothetical protein
MQPENPMRSMLRLAVAETRAVLGQGAHNPSLERDMARLCWIMTLQGGRRLTARLYGSLLRRAAWSACARLLSRREAQPRAATPAWK